MRLLKTSLIPASDGAGMRVYLQITEAMIMKFGWLGKPYVEERQDKQWRPPPGFAPYRACPL